MKRSLVPLACTLILSIHAACSSDSTPADTGSTGGEDASTTNPDATSSEPDAGAGGPDATAPDATTEQPDAGMGLTPAMDPGSYVQVAAGRVEIGDSFGAVKARLGAGQRSQAANTRSYEWAFADHTQLTIWFANTNLDEDDAAPNDVDDTDLVLWIAVTGSFTGKTSQGVGLGSSRAQLETAYGAAPHSVTLQDPAGTLGQYFTTGFLVAYDQGDMVRTFTVCRAYPHAPDANIDTGHARLDFGGAGQLAGTPSLQSPGSRPADVTNLLGTPDAQGPVTIAGQQLTLISYGFLGIEVFASDTFNRVFFMSVHPPYYGKINNGVTLGASRADTEAAIALGAGTASGQNANFVCYEGGSGPDVAVTYSADAAPVATSITIPLIRPASSTSCP